uniref:ARAD1D04158p n=1 Tax=Blastobotrys adeninivorans TaxID=409370 RepID=A0A060T7M3_BLAAD
MNNFVFFFTLITVAAASDWDTYPQVPKTASFNGFADPILKELPSCATECVKAGTGNTPCPYWDTGCLCVMPQWSGQVAECISQNCTAESDLQLATSLAYSLCSSVGANMWAMPASVSVELSEAIVAAATATGESESNNSTKPAATQPSNPSNGSLTSGSSTTNSSGDSSTGKKLVTPILGLAIAGVVAIFA